MAISDKDIFDWFLLNPGADDATIAATMDQFKLSPEDIARATGTDLASAQSRYEAVTPPAPVYTPAAPTPVYEPDYSAQQFAPDVYETPVYTPPATNAYFQSNPDVAAAYAGNSYGMSADDFANFHYNNYGKNEGRYSPSGEPPPKAVVEQPPAVVEQPPAVVEQTPVDTVAENYWKEQAALQQAEWERQAAEQQREWERQAASTPVVTEPTPVPQTPVTTPSVIDEITAGPPTTEEEFFETVSTPPATTPVASTPETPAYQYTKENWPTITEGTTDEDGGRLTTATTSDGTPVYLRDEDGGGMYQNPATQESFAKVTGADGKTYYAIHAPTFSSGKDAYDTPITGYMTEAQYNAYSGRGKSFLKQILSDPGFGMILGMAGPYGQALNAINQADEGNILGAVLSGVNAAGGFGVTDIGGFAIKDVQNVARGLNAINRDDLAGALTAGANLFGGVPGEYATASNFASAGLALKNNDAAGFASAMGDLTKNPDLKIAAAAVKLLDAVNADTINPSALQSAINGLNSAVNKTSTTPADTTKSTTVGDFEDTEVTRLKGLGYTKEQIQEYFNRLDNLTDVLDTPTTTPDTGTKVSDAVTLPTGVQLASAGDGVFRTEVGGVPTYAESSNAATVNAPFGYTLLSMSESDNKPAGSYYDITANAWFKPNAAVTNLTDDATIKSDADLFNQAIGDLDKTTTDTSGTTGTDTTDLGTLLDEVTATGPNTDSGLSNKDLLDLTNIADDTVVVKGGATTSATDAGTIPEVGGGKATDVGGVTIVGDRPTDTVTGSTGADTITGATGNDNVETVTVTGGTGNDTITGGDGNDSVTGGTGNDTAPLSCPEGYEPNEAGTACIPVVVIQDKKCDPGYVYDEDLKQCVPIKTTEDTLTGGTGNDDIEELVVTDKKCDPGYVYDEDLKQCVPIVTTPVVNPPVVVQPPVVQPPVVKPPVVKQPVVMPTYVPSGYYGASDKNEPVYAGAMDDFNLFATLQELLAEEPAKKDNKKSKDKTKMATGGHLDDLLAEQMTVDDLLKLLR